MPFESLQRPTPVFNGKDRMRILSLVALLVFIIVAMIVASKPSTWSWMFPEQSVDAVSEQPDPKTKSKGRDGGHGGGLGNIRLKPGEFLVVEDRESDTGHAVRKLNDSESSVSFHPLINKKLLESFRDDTSAIQTSESEAYFTALARLRDLDSAVLDQAVVKQATFSALMLDSKRYRGMTVILEGEVKMLRKYTESENKHGIHDVYEAWILTHDSGNEPYRVICLEIPDGIPEGNKIAEQVRVRVRGVFLKRHAYASPSGLRKAPLLVAKKLQWLRGPGQAHPGETRGNTGGLTPPARLVGYMAGFFLLFALIVWRVFRITKKFQANRRAGGVNPPVPRIKIDPE